MSRGSGAVYSSANATGGTGGDISGGLNFNFGTPSGGGASASSTATSGSGNASSSANASGGMGGDNVSQEETNHAGGGGSADASSSAVSSGSGGAVSSAVAAGGSGKGSDFGGAGGDASASSTATSRGSGGALSSANASGGVGGDGFGAFGFLGGGGAGGGAGATSTAASSGAGNVTSSATATGGAGGELTFGEVPGFAGGDGGDATATANASAAGGGTAIAKAVATGGVGGGGESPPGALGAATATSSAETAKGALAQAQSTAFGSSGEAESTAKTSLAGISVQSTAVAPTNGDTATTDAIAQGGSGQAFANPGQTAYAFSTGLPNKAYAATLIGGANNVANALLGPSDKVFGTAILGANYAPDGGGASLTYSASSTFDFAHQGDLQLGLIDSQETGFANSLGFESMEFTIIANGVEILDSTFRSLAVAESFFHDDVIDLGSSLGPDVDLTFNYNLVADGSGGFGFDLAVGGAVSDTVPEPSTWAMMLLGFAGLAFAGSRRAKAGDAPLAR
jgi:hypothetical protein